MASSNTFRESALRVVAVLGLIAILLLGAWGIIQIALYLPTLFGTLGRSPETLTVSVPAQSTSDTAFTVTWRHADAAGHTYALSYSCTEGLRFAAPVPTGAFQLVPCDTPFNYINASSSMSIIPVLAAGTARATTTITVAATSLASGDSTARASGRTTVVASTTPASPRQEPSASGQAPAAKPKPSTTYVPSGRTHNLFGLPDLAVHIMHAPGHVSAGSRVTLQFVVTNAGTNVAPAGWMFNAVLPYDPVYVYPSGGQQALYPGDKIVYTLVYDAVPASYYGGYYDAPMQAIIEVDPSAYVAESNKLNNTAVATYRVY